MTDPQYSTFKQRLEAAYRRCTEANAAFELLYRSGVVTEDEADKLADLSGASDALMDLGIAARDSGDRRAAAIAAFLIREAGLDFPTDCCELRAA